MVAPRIAYRLEVGRNAMRQWLYITWFGALLALFFVGSLPYVASPSGRVSSRPLPEEHSEHSEHEHEKERQERATEPVSPRRGSGPSFRHLIAAQRPSRLAYALRLAPPIHPSRLSVRRLI